MRTGPIVLAASLALSVGVRGPATAALAIDPSELIAATRAFEFDKDGLPTSALSYFFQAKWGDGATEAAVKRNRTHTAQHELLHGLGWNLTSKRFKEHVSVSRDGDRYFRESVGGKGQALARLTLGSASSMDAHLDAGWVMTGLDKALFRDGIFNQAQSPMVPRREFGREMAAFENMILDAALCWSCQNLDVEVKVLTTPKEFREIAKAKDTEFRGLTLKAFSAAEKTAIDKAEAAAETLFASNGKGHKFTWYVAPITLTNPIPPGGSTPAAGARGTRLAGRPAPAGPTPE